MSMGINVHSKNGENVIETIKVTYKKGENAMQTVKLTYKSGVTEIYNLSMSFKVKINPEVTYQIKIYRADGYLECIAFEGVETIDCVGEGLAASEIHRAWEEYLKFESMADKAGYGTDTVDHA